MTLPEIKAIDFEMLLDKIASLGLSLVWKTLLFVLIIAIGFWAVRFIDKNLLEKRRTAIINPTVQSFLRSFLRIGMKVIVVLLAVMSIGVESGAILAVIGSAGIAIGLALQGSLSNLASGVLILTNKLFSVGDYIEFGASSGSVVSIGLFYTQLKTPDGKAVYVPNSAITTTTLQNYSVYAVRRMDADFVVAYGTDLDKLSSLLMEMAESNAMILADPEPIVIMLGFGSYSINMRFRVHVYSSNYYDLQNNIYPQLMKKLTGAGIEIPTLYYTHEESKSQK